MGVLGGAGRCRIRSGALRLKLGTAAFQRKQSHETLPGCPPRRQRFPVKPSLLPLPSVSRVLRSRRGAASARIGRRPLLGYGVPGAGSHRGIHSEQNASGRHARTKRRPVRRGPHRAGMERAVNLVGSQAASASPDSRFEKLGGLAHSTTEPMITQSQGRRMPRMPLLRGPSSKSRCHQPSCHSRLTLRHPRGTCG